MKISKNKQWLSHDEMIINLNRITRMHIKPRYHYIALEHEGLDGYTPLSFETYEEAKAALAELERWLIQ